MAIRPWKHFLIPLILLYLAYLLAAEYDDYPSTRVSKSWVNNDNFAVHLTYHNSNYYYMRIILFKEITIAGSRIGFACGFLRISENESFLATGSVQINTYHNTSYLEVIEVNWLANRNKPVHENANLQLLPEGDLILGDADGTQVWSTNTSNMSVTGMKILETGNLVLYDNNNKTVWQSFDYPTDTLLPGQKLKAGQKLVACASGTDWSEGSFYLSVTSRGLFAFYQSQMYFKFSVNGIKETDEPSYIRSVNGALALYILSAEPSEPDVVLLKPGNYSATSYIRFEFDGHIRLYDDSMYNRPVDLLADVLQECQYPTVCGMYGICSNEPCFCPPGFALIDAYDNEGKSGCIETNPTSCENPQSQPLRKLEDVYYFNYVDTDAADLKGIDMYTCEEACLRTCSCKAAFFRYYYNTSHGDCFMPPQVLSLVSRHERIRDYYSNAFLRISNDGESERRYPASATRPNTRVIAISTVGAFLVVLIIGFFVVFLRKKKDTQEDMEDYFDQLSGMPMRFSYEDLKLATGDFQEKLGEGGFGTVFEGTLVNGEKIAVKRLDALGQGKKEFLAEVRTIGSIHHVNLVRLIGFSAEKLHRLLVYEFMGNGSLDKWIFQRTPLQPALDWQTRRSIILDIAKGLAYLHEDCRQKIVHLDIKPQNILLDANLHAKISDFGLSKLIDKDQSQVVTTMRGTPGYLAPEWFSSVITEKVDVYSFGIVVMEIVCGRKNLDRSLSEECMHLLTLFMEKAEEDRLIDMVDKHSEDMQLHGSEVVEMMRVAIWCLQNDYTKRPSMSMVVKVLEGTIDIDQASITLIEDTEVQLEATTSVLHPMILSGPR